MRGKAVWVLGLSGLALLGAVGLYKTLPEVEQGIRSKVTRALADKGLDDVRAHVDGQTVTLTAMDNDPQSKSKLASAKAAVSAIDDGNPWVKVVARIDVGPVVNSAPDTTPKAMLAGAAAPMVVDGADAPVAISGEKATSIDSLSSDHPAVAGAEPMPISNNAAQGCEERVYKAMGTRKLSYVFGGYDLTPDSQPVLDDVYKVLATCPSTLKVTVAGYTDNAGDAVANQLISKARAQAAADALVKRGLPADRVGAAGYGAASPIADNSTPEGRAANRRVVILVSND
jgi:outer membrane protein OmpA-like peptidoglycan-associated protein